MNNFKAYLPLCWFNNEVLRLPQSAPFLKNNLLFYFAVMFFIQFNMSDDIEAIFEVILETLLTLGFIAGILLLNKSYDNFSQVCSAILFTQNAISVLMVPVVFWVTTTESLFSYLILAFLMIWVILLIARIFRQVLFINTAAAMVVALSYFVITYAGAYAIDSLVAG